MRSTYQGVGALFLVLLIYAAVLSIMPRHVFWSPDEGIKFIMLRTLNWNGGLEYTVPYPGADIDPQFRFYPSINPFPHPNDMYPFPLPDGSIYFPWPIWFPLLARFPFLVFGTTGIYLIPLLSGWLTCVMAWRIMIRLAPSFAPWAVILVGIATPIFFYSQTFWEHTAVTLLALFAFWVLVESQSRDLLPLLTVSPIFIVAIILRLEMLAFVFALVLAWVIVVGIDRFSATRQSAPPERTPKPTIHARRRGLLYLFPMALDLFLLSNLANTITPRHQTDIATYTQVVADNMANAPASPERLTRYIANLPGVLLNYTGTDGPRMDGIWLWVGVIAFSLCLLLAFVRSTSVQASLLIPSLLTLLALSVTALWSSQNYRSLHGILLLAPYGAMMMFTLPYAWRRREPRLLFATVATFLYLGIGTLMILATRVNYPGTLTTGLEWGPRYLLPLFPMMVIVTLLGWQEYRASNRPQQLKRVVSGMFVAMMLVSGLYQVRGMWTLYNDKQNIAGWQTALEARGEDPVVTDLWWLPANLATYFCAHAIYVVHPQDATAWLTLAAAHDIRTFTFISQRPIDSSFDSAGMQLLPEDSFGAGDMFVTRMRLTRGP